MPEPKYGTIHSPCKDCERCGCGSYHSQCEKYKEYKQKTIEFSNLRRKPESVLHYYEKHGKKPGMKGTKRFKPTVGTR